MKTSSFWKTYVKSVTGLTRAQIDKLLTEGKKHEWTEIYNRNPSEQAYIYDIVSKKHKGTILCLCLKGLKLEDIKKYEDEVEWDDAYLSAAAVNNSWPLRDIKSLDIQWEYNILSSHPEMLSNPEEALTFIKSHKDKKWCFVTLFENFPYKKFPDEYTDLQICMPSKTFTIKIPSYFQVEALCYHKDIPLGRKSYYTEGNEEKLPDSMLISDILPGSVFILYEFILYERSEFMM